MSWCFSSSSKKTADDGSSTNLANFSSKDNRKAASPRTSFSAFVLGMSDAHPPDYKGPELDEVLRGEGMAPFTRIAYMDHLQSEHNEENLAFWSEVEALRKRHGESDAIMPEETLLRLPPKVHEVEHEWIKGIVNEFVVEGAPYQVNISHDQRNRILKSGQNYEAVIDEEKNERKFVFKEAQLEVRKLMLQDSWPRFVRQCLTQNLNKAEKKYRLYMGIFVALLTLTGLGLMLGLYAPRWCAFALLLPWFLACDYLETYRSGVCIQNAYLGKRMKASLGIADRWKPTCSTNIQCCITKQTLRHTALKQFKKCLFAAVVLTLASFALFYVVEAGVGKTLYG